ncbi:hypothetical protein JIG36_46415 [Actinoplanes sp. LDG1-06]|uniref:Uncharacterized protein n=1 Tax=Paractinoplanes ovalisporus TaxID=2810368 RepID=A0ABS2AT01_9ACTN|nr:hypothetical protein [Actinoplanes ovalisporus]MBM2622959.1 hypothetical protein [Actinoplanes ovalisporus]
MAEALMRDETMSGREIDSWLLPGLPDRITARELVRLRVREEVARFNATGGDVFRGLVRPAAATETPQGFKLPGRERVDWEAQADAACEAFGRNGFVMLTRDRQIDSLDELIDLRDDNEVSFIRLVPLVGG